MPLPLTVSCFSKIQIGFSFLVPAPPGSPRKRAIKWVCACCSSGMQQADATLSAYVGSCTKTCWTLNKRLVTMLLPSNWHSLPNQFRPGPQKNHKLWNLWWSSLLLTYNFMVEAYLPTASIVESIMHRAGVLGCSCINWTTCKQSAPRSRPITTPSPHHSDWNKLEQILVYL